MTAARLLLGFPSLHDVAVFVLVVLAAALDFAAGAVWIINRDAARRKAFVRSLGAHGPRSLR